MRITEMILLEEIWCSCAAKEKPQNNIREGGMVKSSPEIFSMKWSREATSK
jgi:hypothetical protein